MINNPDHIVIGAIVRLKRDDDFQRLVKYLEESLDSIDTDLRRSDPAKTPRLQGGAIALEELLGTISLAEVVFQRMRGDGSVSTPASKV